MFLNFYLLYFPTEIMTLIITLNLLNIKHNWKHVILIPIIHVFLNYFLFSFLSLVSAIIFSILFAILIIKITLNYRLIQAILITLISFSIYLPLANIIFTLNSLFFHNHYYYEILTSFPKTISTMISFVTLLFIVNKLIKQFNFTLTKNDLNEIISNNNQKIIWSILIITLENTFLIYYFMYHFVLSYEEKNKEILLSFSFLIILISLFFIIIKLFKLIEDEVKLATAQGKLENLSELNYTLQRQQHDFKQHLQLLMALLQMKKYDQTLKYLKNVSAEIQETSKFNNSEIQVLNDLLQYKVTLAKKYHINLKINISVKINQLPLNDSKICRLIGNLLDNAIEYLKDQEGIEKIIQLLIQKTKNNYLISVSNPIQKEAALNNKIDKLLIPGYTTKGNGHGLGLSIVKEIVTSNGGKINPYLDPKKGIITFQINLPQH